MRGRERFPHSGLFVLSPLALVLAGVAPVVLLVAGLALVLGVLLPLALVLVFLALLALVLLPLVLACHSWPGWHWRWLYRPWRVLRPWSWLFRSLFRWPWLCRAWLR